MKVKDRYLSLFVFGLLSLFYLLTRQLLFRGFNGTDDLHYAMLAARMIKGTYNPFEPADIFSGRFLLIAVQAAVYRVAGISVWSTQLPSSVMLVVSCYLTVFRLLPRGKAIPVFLGTCIFYFNPLIAFLSSGPLADLYVLFGGLLVCLLLQNWLQKRGARSAGIKTGALIAVIISVFLLFKETMIVFLPFVAVTASIFGRRRAFPLMGACLVVFGTLMGGYALVYLHFTGDPFFKIAQISGSQYPNHCSYDLLPASALVKRLTYEVFQEAITRGFYPLILAVTATLFLAQQKGRAFRDDFAPVSFLTLLLLALFFPFSFHGYQPLCSDTRQFLFLLPLCAVLGTRLILCCLEDKLAGYFLLGSAVMACAVCVYSTGNKWQWMIWLMICACSGILISIPRTARFVVLAALPGTLWVSLLEHGFFQNSDWFRQMRRLDGQISAKTYYFPDHDNMMHWQLLHGFDHEHLEYYLLCEHPFKSFSIYYQHPPDPAFHAGWFILNLKYTVLPETLVSRLSALGAPGSSTRRAGGSDIMAFWIDTPGKLTYIRSLHLPCE